MPLFKKQELTKTTGSEDLLTKVTVYPIKQLTIRLIDRNAPDYIFEGEWTGRDIMLIGRTIARAYRDKQKRARQAAIQAGSEMESTPTTEESNA